MSGSVVNGLFTFSVEQFIDVDTKVGSPGHCWESLTLPWPSPKTPMARRTSDVGQAHDDICWNLKMQLWGLLRWISEETGGVKAVNWVKFLTNERVGLWEGKSPCGGGRIIWLPLQRGRWKCGSGKCRSGKCGSRLQGWKMREWKMQER